MSNSGNAWNLVRLSDVAPQPWKNGGGVTRELLAWPSVADWRVRVSVAEVAQDGPFSRFEGVQRWFAVLAGAGVRLQVAGVETPLGLGSAPFQFDGAADTACQLVDGPTQDFNLMLRASAGRLLRVAGQHACNVNAYSWTAVYSGAAGAELELNGETCTVPAQTLAWRHLTVAAVLRVTAGNALWMEMKP